jgi:DNA-binding transcriptional LysR family regulator
VDWLYSLKVFTIVAETGKMTTAGDSVFLTQPAVSMQIKLLEDFFAVKLFTRHSGGLKLTDEGKVIYSYAKKLTQIFDQMNADLKTLLSKPLNGFLKNISLGSCILISETYMPWIIQKFTKDNPDISINFASMDYQSNVRLLVEGKLDVAIIGFRDTLNNLNEDKLNFEKCSKEQLEIIVPRNYGLKNMQKINIKFLKEKKYVSVKPECGISCVLRQILEKHNLTLEDFKIMSLFGSGSAVKLAVIEGIGWSILPTYFVSQDLSEGKLNAVRLEGLKNPFYRWLYLVHSRSKEEDPSVNLFLQFVKRLKGKYCSIERLKEDVLTDKKI